MSPVHASIKTVLINTPHPALFICKEKDKCETASCFYCAHYAAFIFSFIHFRINCIICKRVQIKKFGFAAYVFTS